MKQRIIMKNYLIVLILLLTSNYLTAQVGRDGTELTPDDIQKVLGIEDRAGGTHRGARPDHPRRSGAASGLPLAAAASTPN
jgi:hypothetical protein